MGAKFPDGGKIWTVEDDKQDDDLTGKSLYYNNNSETKCSMFLFNGLTSYSL